MVVTFVISHVGLVVILDDFFVCRVHDMCPVCRKDTISFCFVRYLREKMMRTRQNR